MIYGNRRDDGLYAVELEPVANSYTASLAWFSDIRAELCAPVLFNFDLTTPGMYQVAICGRDDKPKGAPPSERDPDTLYVWMADGAPYLNDPVPDDVRPGAFGALPDINDVTNFDAWRSLAVTIPASYGAYPDESYLIQTTRQGGLLAWANRSRSLGTLATEEWAVALQDPAGGYTLSPPLVCNLLPDIGPYAEINVTNTAVDNTEDPTIWILDDYGSGTSISDEEWTFYNSGGIDPPPRPVGIRLTGSNFHMVGIAGGGEGQVNSYAYKLQSTSVSEMVDNVPLPSRGYSGGGEGWVEPLLAQVDDAGGTDLLVPTRMKSLVGWDLSTGEPKLGWPLLIGEQPLTPAVSGDRLFVAAGETLHCWSLPSSNSGSGWSQYAGGPRRYGDDDEFWGDNHARVPGPDGFRPAPRTALFGLQAIQRPGSAQIRLEYSVAPGREYILEAFDVGGRRVARLANGVGGENGETRETMWTPKLASGVYFIRLDDGAATATRRVVFVR
jgi:hypothetical protein